MKISYTSASRSTGGPFSQWEQPTDSNPLAKETFKKVIDHLSATKGAYSLQNKTTSTTTEDDKLKKTWKWKTNDGKVDVTVSVDVKMAKQKKA